MRQPENAHKKPQPDVLVEDFQSRMNASTGYWQQKIADIAKANITDIEQPTPRVEQGIHRGSNPTRFIFQLIHPVWRLYHKHSRNSETTTGPDQKTTEPDQKTAGPDIIIIAPGVELIVGSDLPDTTVSDCTLPDTQSELTNRTRDASRREDYRG